MLDEFTIRLGSSVRDALKQLEKTERQTLFVVDASEHLIGAVTDGDVRRWILSGGKLDGLIEKVCNRRPITTLANYDPEEIREQMLSHHISCIPVVDSNNKIADVLVREQIFDGEGPAARRKPIDLPVAIMAGGEGTRMAPFTSVLPKPLIPIGNKTVIELIVESFTDYSVNKFYLSVNYKSKIIKSYFDELDPPYDVEFIYEDKPLGTAGSLAMLAEIDASDIIVTNCDVIIRANYHELVRQHRETGHDLTVVASVKDYLIPYGICDVTSGGDLIEIREKPELNFLVNTGLYVLRVDLLRSIPSDKSYHMTDLISDLRRKGGSVGVFPIGGDAWMDTGEWNQYRSAVAQLAPDRRRKPRR